MNLEDLVSSLAAQRCVPLARAFGVFKVTIAILFANLLVPVANAQSILPVQWESLTSGDFVKAIQQSQGTCILPFGILEKHGQQLPLGTDLLNVRYVAINAAHKEFAVVFPEYYFGQIFEARHEPGTI